METLNNGVLSASGLTYSQPSRGGRAKGTLVLQWDSDFADADADGRANALSRNFFVLKLLPKFEHSPTLTGYSEAIVGKVHA